MREETPLIRWVRKHFTSSTTIESYLLSIYSSFKECFCGCHKLSSPTWCLPTDPANGRPELHSLKIQFCGHCKANHKNAMEIPTTIPLVTLLLCCCKYTAIHSRGDAYSLGFLPPPKNCHQFRTPAGILPTVANGLWRVCLAGDHAMHCMWQLAAQCSSSHSQHILSALGDESHMMMCHTAPIPTTILRSNKPNRLEWLACLATSVH